MLISVGKVRMNRPKRIERHVSGKKKVLVNLPKGKKNYVGGESADGSAEIKKKSFRMKTCWRIGRNEIQFISEEKAQMNLPKRLKMHISGEKAPMNFGKGVECESLKKVT